MTVSGQYRGWWIMKRFWNATKDFGRLLRIWKATKELDQVNSANLLFESWSFFSVLVCYRKCREEKLSRGTIVARDNVARDNVVRDIVAKDIVARDIDIWWYWIKKGRYWVVFGGTGSVWGSTGWYLVILGHNNMVLCGIKCYWVNKGLLCLYILKKINGDVNRPTNQPTDQPTDRVNIEQSAFFES